MTKISELAENTKAQMRKGFLEYCILLILSKEPRYSSDILSILKAADLLVVEGTLYPLLNRLKKAELLEYEWKESPSGPPRKYYALTNQGRELKDQLTPSWEDLSKSIKQISKQYE